MMYLMHIAVFFGLIVTAAGIVGLRFAAKERSGHFKLASWISSLAASAASPVWVILASNTCKPDILRRRFP